MLLSLVFVTLLFTLFGSGVVNAATQTLTILGAQGTQGQTDAYTEFSRDGGQTWNKAYLSGWHPWGFVPGTNSWLNCGPSGYYCVNTDVLYRVRFNVPQDFSNPQMKFEVKADNYAKIWLNGTYVTEIEGSNQLNSDAVVNRAVTSGLNEIRLLVRDFGVVAGINYKITINMDAPTPPVPVGNDAIPPVTTVGLPQPIGTTGANRIYASDITVQLSATDNLSGVDKTEYRLNGGNWFSYSAPFDLTQEGSYVLENRSTDKAGNVETTHTASFMIDKTAPTTTATVEGFSGETGYYSSNISVQGNATDNLSGVARTEYRINGSDWTTYLEPFSIGAEGTYQVEYRSIDAAGNIESTHLQTYVIDTTAPQTTLDIQGQPGGSSGWYTTDIILALPCHDPNLESTRYRINGGEWITYTGPITLPDGEYTIEYQSMDKAGDLESIQSTKLKVDTTAPVATVQLPPANNSGWYTSDVEVKFSATDNLSGVATIEYYIEDGKGNIGPWTTYGGSLVIRQNCGCKIHYRTTDEAGNQSPVDVIEVKVDKTPPTLNIRVDKSTLWPPNHKMVPIHVTVEASDADSGIASVVLTSITSNEPDNGLGDGDTANDIQGAEFGTNDIDFQLRAERSGTGKGRVYTITYTATDYAGNVTVATATVTVPHSQK